MLTRSLSRFIDWRDHAKTKKKADLLWAAGCYMADAAACLFEFGRNEAPVYCDFADYFYRMAEQW